mgnify:CR=1 FL=1|tara:strand:- start:18437 stop:22423 length:3987 start_codon:yes stop_codon:yes gene_type:complete
MAIHTLSDVPFSVTGGLSANHSTGHGDGTRETLSGYTNKLTTFRFAVTGTSSLTYSPDSTVWDFGDGTTTKGFSATHVYTEPGVYNVQLINYNSSGEEIYSTHTKQLSVVNFLTDNLTRPYDDIINLLNVPAGTGGVLQKPITIDRVNTWQPHNMLSGTGYTLTLYSSGSRSRKLDIKRFNEYKWSHLDKTWSFYEKLTADSGAEIFNPIESIKTTNEDIYIALSAVEEGGFTRNAFIRSISSNPDAVFVGTSGTAEFFYGDDTAKNYSSGVDDSPIFLFATLDTSNFPFQSQISNNNYYGIDTLPHYESYRVTIPAKTRFSRATSLTFTTNGLLEMPLGSVKWQNCEVPFVISFVNQYNSRAEDYPALSINSSTTPNSSTWVVNVSVVSSCSTGTNTRLLSADFFRTKDGQLPNSIESTYRGYFIPREVGDNVSLKGEVVINDPAHNDRDILFGYLTNPEFDNVYRVAPGEQYEFDGDSGVINTSLPGNRTETLLSAGGYYPVSVVPVTASYLNNKVYAYFADSHNDKVFKYNNNMELLSTFDFSQKVQITTSSITTSATLISINDKDSPDRLTPSDITIDSEKRLWVPMHDGNLVVRIDPDTGYVDRVIRDDSNVTYNTVLTSWREDTGPSFTTTVSATSGLAGFNLTEPTTVDCDLDDNIWIAYSNPLNGFIIKYDTSVDPCSAIVKYDFPDYEAPTDIVVDNDNNIWVATQKHFIRNVLSEKTGVIEAKKLDHVYDFQFADELGAAGANFEPGQLIHIPGGTFTNPMRDPAGIQCNYNGWWIIQAVSAHDAPSRVAGNFNVEVHPYAGLVHSSQASRNITVHSTEDGTGATGAVTVKSYESDNVYKFDSSGTLLHKVSGFHIPSYIVVDNHQNAWVTHDTNTVTRITSAGQIDKNIPILDTDFVELSGGKGAQREIRGVKQHLGGITCDFYNRLWVINSFENRIHYLPLYNMSLSSIQYIDEDQTTAGIGSNMYQAIGDWTGYEWFNKYIQVQGQRVVTGNNTFTIYPSTGQYSINKFGEDFDPAETIKSYRQQPFLKNYNKLFNDIIGISVGTLSSQPTELGKVVYEKISNFVQNHNDIDTCTIDALYSICDQFDVPIENYKFGYPASIKRVMDLASVHRKHLWGDRSKYARDFESLSEFAGYNSNELAPATRPINIGLKTVVTNNLTAYHVDELDASTYMVSAGTKLVAKQLYDSQFKLINPMYLSGTGSEPFSATANGISLVSAYPLSSYHVNWGWGLYNDINGLDIKEYYKFYSYNEEYNNTQQEGLIDWENSLTTVKELSHINTWAEDDGIIDVMLDYELRRGLNMFTDSISAGTSEYQ